MARKAVTARLPKQRSACRQRRRSLQNGDHPSQFSLFSNSALGSSPVGLKGAFLDGGLQVRSEVLEQLCDPEERRAKTTLISFSRAGRSFEGYTRLLTKLNSSFKASKLSPGIKLKFPQPLPNSLQLEAALHGLLGEKGDLAEELVERSHDIGGVEQAIAQFLARPPLRRLVQLLGTARGAAEAAVASQLVEELGKGSHVVNCCFYK